jgi:hypothetical protein
MTDNDNAQMIAPLNTLLSDPQKFYQSGLEPKILIDRVRLQILGIDGF